MKVSPLKGADFFKNRYMFGKILSRHTRHSKNGANEGIQLFNPGSGAGMTTT